MASRPTTVIDTARQSLDAQIQRQGTLALTRRTYLRRNVELFGPQSELPASATIAGRLTKPGRVKPKSTILTVGEAPNGCGKTVLWHADDAGLALVVFLNAGDDLGVMISGVRPTDTIQIVTAAGVASFAEDTENEGVGAFIGIVAAGASLGASAFGAPELAPVITAAGKFAADRFQEKKVKTKRRDPFGVDPGTGHKARQEGGVIVSLPQAGGVYYSGNEDHEERWIKTPGTRDNAHRPSHVKGAFFLRRNAPKEVARVAGDFIITPWDYSFLDNFGFYRLHVLVKRGSGTFPEPEVD
jgi:hypothetical protein